MNKYSAKKTTCAMGHKHDSAREARRCSDLHLLQRANEIMHLQVQPRFEFVIGGKPVMMKNHQVARYTPDFSYVEVKSGKQVAEDSKGMITQDYRLRSAIFRHLFPNIELREV